MKANGRFTVRLYQTIHGMRYPFTVVVVAGDKNEAKKKAETTFVGYVAV